MADNSKIEWTEATWNPVTGCTKVSPGCDHCYAETFAERWRGATGHHFESGFDVTLRPERLDQPLRWKRPRRIFVNSMSDLFHEAIPDEFIARVFAVMALTEQHTYQVLTKRHGRMRSLLNSHDFYIAVLNAAGSRDPQAVISREFAEASLPWPLPNVWAGVSVENQQWADIRVPALLDTPAAVRFLSCEPLLGPVDLTRFFHWRPIGKNLRHTPMPPSFAEACGLPALHWVIVGGESGRGARPMRPDWARGLRNGCVQAGVPFFFKQWGEWVPPLHMPADTFMSWDCENGTSAYDRDEPWRIGKKRAGRELDGRTWDEFPS